VTGLAPSARALRLRLHNLPATTLTAGCCYGDLLGSIQFSPNGLLARCVLCVCRVTRDGAANFLSRALKRQLLGREFPLMRQAAPRVLRLLLVLPRMPQVGRCSSQVHALFGCDGGSVCTRT